MAERRAVAQFLDMELDDPALTAVLCVQRDTGLSVFNGELFAVEDQVPSRDAAGVVTEKWVRRPAAGRDGFLAVAERSGVFGGIVGDVVCANDAFDVDWGQPVTQVGAVHFAAAGGPPLVRHRHAALAGGATAAEARAFRGPIIGAWAKGLRTDRAQPMFYFAPLKQHGRVWGTPEGGELTWLGAWEYTNAMILKCAMSYVLRILFVITGVLPADEVKNDPTLARETSTAAGLEAAADRVRRAVDVAQVLDIPETIPAEASPETRTELLAAIEQANSLDPTAWTAAKCSMTFGGRSDGELAKIAADIRAGARSRAQARERDTVMPPDPKPEELPPDGHALPESVEELRAQLVLAQARAGAAQSDTEHAAAIAEADRIRDAIERRGEPAPPAS